MSDGSTIEWLAVAAQMVAPLLLDPAAICGARDATWHAPWGFPRLLRRYERLGWFDVHRDAGCEVTDGE